MDRRFIAAWFAGALLIAARANAIDWNNPRDVIDAAITASPSLREMDARIAAARARAAGAGTLPNPMLMAGVQNRQIDLSSDPMTMYMVGASQTFLRKDRRESLQRAAALDVQQLEREREIRVAEITRDVLVAYDEAAAAVNQIAANEEIASLAASTGEAAKIRYETGFAPQIDIIRAKLEETNIRHAILMQRGVRDQALARLRALLALPAGAAIPSFALGHAMEHHDRAVAERLDVPKLPTAVLEAAAARAEEEIRLVRLVSKPDVNLEASYGFRPQQKDMISVVARIELPVRKATIAPRIAEATAERDAALARIDILRQKLQSELGKAIAQRDEAIEQINLHVEQLVPQAKLGFESAVVAYQSGKSSFDAVIGALQTYRTLSVDYYDFLRQLLVAEALIDALQHGAESTVVPEMGGAR
ncbi:MAG: outer membrane protein heavy metal efflux system [Thermoanaerobaculia bacterium]|jgi:outer membrane protein TolC|nr:outer membrane protein heavy metal efflux system [Thermoanaerobaculia bacterium]